MSRAAWWATKLRLSLVERRRQALVASEADIAALLRKAFDRAVQGAECRPMAEVAPLVRRPVDIQPDASYLELGVRSFGRGTFHKPALDGMAVGSKKLFRIEPQDLVFNIVFAWEGAVAIAKADDCGRVGSHRFLTCVPNPEISTVDFLLYFFLSPEGLRALGDASPGGAGRKPNARFEEAGGNQRAGAEDRETALVRPPPSEGPSIASDPCRSRR